MDFLELRDRGIAKYRRNTFTPMRIVPKKEVYFVQFHS